MTDTSLDTPTPRAALISGGSRGIGAAIALHFAERRLATHIAITYASNLSAAENVVAKLYSFGVKKAVALQADIFDPNIGDNLVPAVLQRLSVTHLDVIVNNAGVVDTTIRQPILSSTLENFQKQFQGNVFAAVSIISAAFPHLPPQGGRVINISSVASKEANSDPRMVYGASKAALDSVTRSMAATLASSSGATFNSVSVGGTASDSFFEAKKTLPKTVLDEMLDRGPSAARRFAEPQEVAKIVGFLSSQDASWVNGANMMANGGQRTLLALQG